MSDTMDDDVRTDEYYGQIIGVTAWPGNDEEPLGGIVITVKTGASITRRFDNLPRQYDLRIRRKTLPRLFLECGYIRNHDLSPEDDARRLVGSRLFIKTEETNYKNPLSIRKSVTDFRAAPEPKEEDYLQF